MYAKNQINPEGKDIHNLELSAAVVGAAMLHECSLLIRNVKQQYLFIDSEVVCWELQRQAISLTQFARNRVMAILRLIPLASIYHVLGSHNIADKGTRPSEAGLEDAKPTSQFFTGPPFLQDVEKAMEKGIITPVLNYKAPPHVVSEGIERLPSKFSMPEEYFGKKGKHSKHLEDNLIMTMDSGDDVTQYSYSDQIVENDLPVTVNRRSRRIKGLPPMPTVPEEPSAEFDKQEVCIDPNPSCPSNSHEDPSTTANFDHSPSVSIILDDIEEAGANLGVSNLDTVAEDSHILNDVVEDPTLPILPTVESIVIDEITNLSVCDSSSTTTDGEIQKHSNHVSIEFDHKVESTTPPILIGNNTNIEQIDISSPPLSRSDVDPDKVEKSKTNINQLPEDYLWEILSEEDDAQPVKVDSPYNVKKTEERFLIHKLPYLVNPIELGWKRAVEVVALVHFAASKWRKKFRVRKLIDPENMQNLLKSFTAIDPLSFDTTVNTSSIRKTQLLDIYKNPDEVMKYRFIAIQYFLLKASHESRVFISRQSLQKHSFDEKGILYARSRVTHVSELEMMIDNVPPLDLSIQRKILYLDRFSPITIALIHHFHVVTRHRGVDGTLSELNQACIIFKGLSLVTSVVRQCLYCRKKLKKRMYTTMGPISNRMLWSPVNYHVVIDVAGPFSILRGLRSHKLRGTTNKMKVWTLISVCVISHYTTAHLLMDYSASEFLNAFVRMSTVTGFPKRVYMDSSTSEIRGMTATPFVIGDVVNGAFRNFHIEVKLCGVTGPAHSRHGLVERRIRTFSNFINTYNNQIQHLSYTQFETIIQAACSYMNACPLALKERTNKCLTAQFITSNSFLTGARSSYRSPLSVPLLDNRNHALENINAMSVGLSKFYSAHIGSFLLKAKWNQDGNDDISIGDMVLIEHTVGKGLTQWKLALVVKTEEDSDGVSRIVTTRYSNASEIQYPQKDGEDTTVRVIKHDSRRATQRLVKIYSISDRLIDEDLRRLARLH